MKTRLLFTLLITSFYLQAQVSDFVTGLTNEPSRLIIDNNIIYVIGVATPTEILEIDLTDSNPSSNVTFTTANGFGIGGIFKEGDIIYISRYDENTGESSLISFNVNTPSSLTLISSGFGYIATIAKFNDELYFTDEDLSGGGIALKKIDVTMTNPPVDTVVTGLTNPQDMEFNGDVLYIGDRDAGGGIGIIYSIDITLSMPVLNSFITNANVRGVYVYNDFLYFSDGGLIKKAPFLNPSNITTEAFDNDANPEFLRDVVISGTNLYMPQEDSGKIVTKEDLTLSVNDFNNQFSNLSIYNNQNELQINGLTNEKYSVKIFNLTGSKVLERMSNSNNNNSINISNLTNGIYLLNINNVQTFKFVK
ncbi:T9SS type A sorting domain-containing protein [Winogradskyella schleiferi]|uniref:T9SS type A sorting domain-containing protein n=1 Tax=Winogradskyella schleiferi TaxID=2686078 RepID=UPI0015BD1E92|nr:T9SS type A sorting domain-containing protein [Winogradskyella schleiferi]